MAEAAGPAGLATFSNASALLKQVQSILGDVISGTDVLKPIGFSLPDSIINCKDGLDSMLESGDKLPDAMKEEPMELEPGWQDKVKQGITLCKDILAAISPAVDKAKLLSCVPCIIPMAIKAPIIPDDLGPLDDIARIGKEMMAKASGVGGMVGGFMDQIKVAATDAVDDAKESAGVDAS